MTTSRIVLDYTRVSDDTAILCRRKDFPRAMNVLQRRAPDRRRWRLAFRQVAWAGDHGVEGAKRAWLDAALREVVHGVGDRRLRSELAIDAAELGTRWDLNAVLPSWSARDLWRLAEDVDLPMQYVTMVTDLPRAISAPIDTARVIADCRRTSEAHRQLALAAGADLPATAVIEEVRGALDPNLHAKLAEVRGQQEASRRWRELAHRLLQPA
ncbi:MAG: hypothetical protein U0324_22355 [Polyangiales bacterium]